MYKLLALDIDDTLLDSRGELSPENRQAIARAAAAGVTVTVSTGRSYRGACSKCADLQLKDIPVITFGGAKIVEYPSGSIMFESLLSHDNVRELLDYTEKEGIYAQFYDGDDFLYCKECEESEYYSRRLKHPGKLTDFAQGEFNNCAKVLLILSREEIDERYAELKKKFSERYSVVQSSDRFIEFYKKGTDKGSALRWLGEHMGITREQIIAIGDNGIDAPMIEYAGLGIAVSNATDEAKQVADLITVSCDENAVAHIVNTIIFKEETV